MDWFNDKNLIDKPCGRLNAEGNYYYDNSKCMIGFHGDTERHVVVGIRFGSTYPLHFQWYKNSETVSDIKTIHLNGGDMYVMSEKAVGTDWKSSSKYTLRHSAGNLNVILKNK